MTIDVTARAVNAAATAAQLAVLQYAHRFERREDYRPLEELAAHVQRMAVEAGVVARRDAEQELDLDRLEYLAEGKRLGHEWPAA